MTDEELIAALRVEYGAAADAIEQKLDARWQEKFRTFVQEQHARFPVAAGAGDVSPDSYAAQLTKDGSFAKWVESGSRNHFSKTLRLQTKAAITSAVIQSPVLVPGIASVPQLALRLRDLIPKIPARTGGQFTYTTGAFPATGGAAIQLLEGDKKAESTATFGSATLKPATIAHFVKVAVQTLADVPLLQTWLENQLIYSCLLKEEDVIVNGDTPAAINGLLDVAQAVPAGFIPATPTWLDIVGGVIGALLARGFLPDAVVMNAQDATAARLLKSSTGEYLWSMPAGSLTTQRIWATQLVVAPSMTAGTALVAALGQAAFLVDRETVGVDIAYENEDDFIKNLACLRGELRSGLGVPLPSGVLKVTNPPV